MTNKGKKTSQGKSVDSKKKLSLLDIINYQFEPIKPTPQSIVEEFYKSLYSSGFGALNPDALNMFVSILYLHKTKNIEEQWDVEETNPRVFVRMNLQDMYNIDWEEYQEWIADGHTYRCLINTLPEEDPMYNLVKHYLSYQVYFDFDSIFITKYDLDEINPSLEDYSNMMDIAIKEFFKQSSSTKYETYQQVELLRLMASLVNEKAKKIFEPFVGVNSFSSVFSGYEKYTGLSINQNIVDLLVLRSAIVEAPNCVFRLIENGNIQNYSKDNDIVISCPLFGTSFFEKNIKDTTYLLKHFGEMTNENGQMVLLTSYRETFADGQEKRVREALTNANVLDKIIVLPNNILNGTSVRSTIIVLRKGLEDNHKVSLIDISEAYLKKNTKVTLDLEKALSIVNSVDNSLVIEIDRNTIAENDYTWSLDYYKTIAKQKNIPDGYESVRLSDILEPIKCSVKYAERKGRVVKVSHLSDSWVDYEMQINAIPLLDDMKNCRKLEEPALLISKIRFLKPTYCNASKENPIFLNGNVYAFRVRPEIHIGYLCYVLNQSNFPFEGATIPSISITTFLRMEIAMAPLAMQAQLYNEAKYVEDHAVIAARGFEKELESLKQGYMEEVRMRKHDLIHPLGRMQSWVKNMREIIADATDLEIVKSEFESRFESFMSDYSKAYSILQTLSKEDAFESAEKFDMDAYFKKMRGSYDNYRIEYERSNDLSVEGGKDEHLYTSISKVDFTRMVENILENAKKHGFVDSNRKDYVFKIIVSLSEKGDYQIDFSNNGDALPIGMDEKRYALKGEKAGAHGGTGIGGYVIASIAKHFNGSFQLFSEETASFMDTKTKKIEKRNRVTVRVCIPKYEEE